MHWVKRGVLLVAMSCSSGMAFSQVADVLVPEDPFADVTWEQLATTQEKIVLQFILATAQIARAQSEMAASLELKEEAALMAEEADALQADSAVDKNRLSKHAKISKKTNAKIVKALKKKKELSKEQQQGFTQGISHYAVAVGATREVYYEAEPFARAVRQKAATGVASATEKVRKGNFANLFSSGSGDTLRRFTVGLHLAKAVPGLLKNHGKTMRQIMSFMQSNNIPVPDTTSQLMTAMDGDVTVKGGGWKARFSNIASGLLGNRAATPPCPAAPSKHCLWIKVTPGDATIVLPDIKPKYAPGIPMDPKVHRVIARAPGYQEQRLEVDLSTESKSIEINLQQM